MLCERQRSVSPNFPTNRRIHLSSYTRYPVFVGDTHTASFPVLWLVNRDGQRQRPSGFITWLVFWSYRRNDNWISYSEVARTGRPELAGKVIPLHIDFTLKNSRWQERLKKEDTKLMLGSFSCKMHGFVH